MKRSFFLFFSLLFLLNHISEAQQLSISEDTEISILTIGPGPYLYDKFGHTSIRVKDPRFDLAFNYGVYDFNTPNFYTKFAQGKLLYILDVRGFDLFINSYQRQNRWVKEQVLNLTYAEKKELFSFLQNNAKEENRAYLYDFFYDNCATRPRDVLNEVLANKISYDDSYLEKPSTFRELIQENVPSNSWGSLGMDVAIGAVTDVQANAWQHQYLPFYLEKATQNASIIRVDGSKIPLVKENNILFENAPIQEKSLFFLSPLFIFGMIALLILVVTFRDYKKRTRSRFMDAAIFFITGLIGIFLTLLWFATDHSTTANNYNLLWAFPFSILLTFAIAKKQPKKWVQRFVFFLILMLCLMLVHSMSGVQRFAIGLIPLFIALGIRYLYISFFLKRTTA